MTLSILHYLADVELERGGIVRSVLDLCSALSDRGHTVTLATCNPRDVPPGWDGPSAPQVVRLQRSWGGVRFTHASQGPLDRALDGCDVVHFHNLWNLELIPLASRAVQAGRPYVISPHGTLDGWSMSQSSLKKRAYLALRGRRMIERSAGVHFAASEEQRAATRWISTKQGSVIPLIVDLRSLTNGDSGSTEPAAAASRGEDVSAPTLLFLSRLHPKKRLETLLEAVAMLRDRGLPTTLVVAGTGDPRYLEQLTILTRCLDLDAQVRFLGNVVGDQKNQVFRSADLFVVPTSQENFGIVFVEALATGTPVVTTRGTDIWRELADTGGAAIVDLDQVENPAAALAAVLETLLGDRDRLHAMAASGRRAVLEWLDVERTSKSFEGFYEHAMAHSGNQKENLGLE